MNAPTPEAVTTVAFAREELGGKLLALCVKQLESFKVPWNMTAEKNQEIALAKMREVIGKAVNDAVLIIASDRRPTLRAKVDSVTFKDGVKAVLTLGGSTDGRHDLADAAGGTVLLCLIPGEYATGTEKVAASSDQRGLDLQEPAGNETADTKSAPPADSDLPEIRMEANETYTIYVKGEPLKGGTGFGDSLRAEKWLLKTQGYKVVDGKMVKVDQSPAAPPDEKKPPAPKLEDATKAFKEAGQAAAKSDTPDWDGAWATACKAYPKDFVDEYFTELTAAFTDGWEEGSGD